MMEIDGEHFVFKWSKETSLIMAGVFAPFFVHKINDSVFTGFLENFGKFFSGNAHMLVLYAANRKLRRG